MAKMIPAKPNKEDFNRSRGEQEVFYALKEGLSNEYTVFHSYLWNTRNSKGSIEWGEADFTIFHPKYGLLVIEVKSGGIALDGEGQWWYIRTNDQKYIPMKNDPMVQANRTKYSLKEELDKLDLQGDYFWIESAVWFPHLSDRKNTLNFPNPYKDEIVLTNWALQNPREAIEKAFKFYSSRYHTRLSKESAQKIVHTLAPTFNAVPSLRSVYSEQEADFLRLTKEQNALLDFLDEQPTAVIQGSAGTGKTLLAVEKARRLSKSGKVLFLCFNRFLLDELRNNRLNDEVDYYNLPSLVVRQCGKSDLVTDEVITDYLLDYDTIGYWDYKHIVIDEGQDFNGEHIEILATIAEIQNGAFYVFYDKNQLVQRNQLPQWVNDAECRLILRRNCRNTLSIATTAGRPINIEPYLWENSVHGKRPNFHIVNDLKALKGKLHFLIKEYVEASIPLNQITILTLEIEERSVLNGISTIGTWPISTSKARSAILFTTARKFKGLESDAIIVIDVNPETFHSAESKNLFYVGTSRAKSFLDLIACVDEEELYEIAEHLKEDKRIRSAISTIATSLKVKMNE